MSRHIDSIRQAAPWLLVEVMMGSALVLWAAGLAGIATNLLILVAAVTSVANLVWQRMDSTDQRAQMKEQSTDIKRIADLAERTHALQLAEQPQPTVTPLDSFGSEAGASLSVERQPMVVLEWEAMLAETLDPLRNPPEPEEGLIGAMLKTSLARQPEFQAEVDTYEGKLRAWLATVEAYFLDHYEAVTVPLRVTNGGGGPLRDAEVLIDLPDGLATAEQPTPPPRPPEAPEPRLGLDLGRLIATNRYFEPLDSLLPDRGPLDGPWPDRDGSRYSYGLEQLLHGLSVDAAEEGDGKPMLVRVRADGEYVVRWRIHAANMTEPPTGSFLLQVATVQPDPVRISTLETLTSVLWPAAR